MTLSWTQLSATFLEELKLLSMELGMPTVTPMLDPERACSTSGSASKSFTLEMLLDFKSSNTFNGGRGCEDVVPQFTPIATAVERRGHTVAKKRKRKRRPGGIWPGGGAQEERERERERESQEKQMGANCEA